MVSEHSLVKRSGAIISTRDLILDAAARVMHEQGIARATTKEIAREAGYSEATLYKHFGDKQEIFIAVLSERLPPLQNAAELAGTGDVLANLATITAQLLRFYLRSFPMAASIFSDRELLAQWRDGMTRRGAGPRGPLRMLEDYLAAEVALGRLPSSVDAEAVTALLAGAALSQAFLTNFDAAELPDIDGLAARLVAALAL